jgi:hypothetical protein
MKPETMPGVRESFWRRVREVWDVLAFTFDFDAFEQALSSEAYATPAPWLPAFVVPGASVSVVARDGTGGVYVSCEQGQDSCCLHLDTQGNAVCIGEDWPQAVALLVALPYWPELLAQCRTGELSALRAAAQRLEREACEDLPALPAARQELQAFLELPELADPVLRLKQLAVDQSVPVTVWSPHGWRYGSPVRRGEQLVGSP